MLELCKNAEVCAICETLIFWAFLVLDISHREWNFTGAKKISTHFSSVSCKSRNQPKTTQISQKSARSQGVDTGPARIS